MKHYTPLRHREWRTIIKMSLIIGLISAFLNIIINLQVEEELRISVPLILLSGLISLFLGTLNPFFILLIEFFFLQSKKIRSLPAIFILCIRIPIYLMIGSILYLMAGLLFFPEEIYNRGGILFSLIAILFFSISISLINFFSQFLGSGFLKSFLISKYHQAKIQSAIFMFIDLKGSTSLAEQTRPETFFQFLNDFIYLCQEVIKVHEGSIYKYVGDSIIVVWDENPKNLKRSYHCMKELNDHIYRNRPYFRETYKNPIAFTIGIHAGPTTIGEIGFDKKEIGYLSDTINTAQRIQDCNKALHTEILLSKDYIERLREWEVVFKEDHLKEHRGVVLKGKDKTIDLYSYKKEMG